MKLSLNESNHHRIHFIGIGGISMSAIGKLCLFFGFDVSGSDEKKSNITTELEKIGVRITYKHQKENIENADLVVYTSAVKEDNVELVEARRKKIEVLERADFLKLICDNYKNVIAISGTHGKTTTTAMIGSVFLSAGKNPTIHLGGECDLFGGNLKIGSNDFFITEACEYQKHLLKVPHNVGVVLNIEPDHLDCYKSLKDLHNTFSLFCESSKEMNIINESYTVLLNNQSNYQTTTFGKDCASNFYAKNIKQYKNGKIIFDCYKNGYLFYKFELNCYGKHNVLNALATISVCDYYLIPKCIIFNGLKNFTGIKRRFEFIKRVSNNMIIADYAHHPTEIKTTIENVKDLFNKKVVVFFQPHTYSRTKSLLKDFMTCFDSADITYILPTYPAREKPIKKANGKFLYKMLKLTSHNVKYIKSIKQAKEQIYSFNNSIILILGAGDIYELAMQIKNDIKGDF